MLQVIQCVDGVFSVGLVLEKKSLTDYIQDLIKKSKSDITTKLMIIPDSNSAFKISSLFILSLSCSFCFS